MLVKSMQRPVFNNVRTCWLENVGHGLDNHMTISVEDILATHFCTIIPTILVQGGKALSNSSKLLF